MGGGALTTLSICEFQVLCYLLLITAVMLKWTKCRMRSCPIDNNIIIMIKIIKIGSLNRQLAPQNANYKQNDSSIVRYLSAR